MIRSVTFEIPPHPQAIIQRRGGKRLVVIRLEDARKLVAELEDALAEYPLPLASTDQPAEFPPLRT